MMEKKSYKGKIIGIIIMITAIIAIIVGFGYWKSTQSNSKNDQNEVVNTQDENLTLKDRVIWKDSSKEVEAFKKLSITAYPDKPIGEAFSKEYSVNEWKYGRDGNEEYLLCNYTFEKKEATIIFYKDTYENVNIAEYYIGNQKQDKKSIEKESKALFEKKSEPTTEKPTTEKTTTESQTTEEIKFQGRTDVPYEIEDQDLDCIIEIQVSGNQNVTVNMAIADSYDDLSFSGKVISNDTIQVTLEAGEKINFIWSGKDSFVTVPKSGFEDETIQMMRLMCECLNNQSYIIAD